MKLSELLNNDAQFSAEAGGLIVAGLGADSRAIKPGDVFFALAGTKADGARYAAQAAALGAVAIVADHVIENVAPAHCAVAANPRLALAKAAARFYPRQPDVIAAVTGTSGKTSVAAFLQQIWTMMGHR